MTILGSFDFSILNRWANVQLDGTIGAIDRALSAMEHFASAAQQADDPDVVNDALVELESAACYVVAKLQTALALDPDRCTHLPFPPAFVLVAVLGRTLCDLSYAVRKAVEDGAYLAEDCNVGLVSSHLLTGAELTYQV